ncbi:CocE/NonD family hydrolase [Mycolicibacterium moriokaense]|nr:CocE/NonD family hydrolase [Mycolicibacterium moriokaense]
MRDGTRIAMNAYVPQHSTSDGRLPTILHQTRYYRSMELRRPLRMLTRAKTFEHIPPTAKSRRRFVANGYAWVDVDVRGSGASYGSRACEWSPDEIRDGAEVVDWIVRQPWSDGRVGSLGTSYDGACAEFLLVNRHPAVLAAAPRFALFDAYTDIAFPGGIHATWFTESWGRYNDALDRNSPHEVAGWWVKLLVTGVQPTQADEDRTLRDGAIAAHENNYDVHEQAKSLVFRDDVAPSDPYHGVSGSAFQPVGSPIDESGSINLFSPHNYWHDTAESGAAIYSYGGWFDGGYAHAAIKRFLTIPNDGSRLILGPWNHGGRWHIDTSHAPTKSKFDHDGELLRFFDHHLKGGAGDIGSEQRVHYFTMGENRWRATDVWPPPATARTYYLSAARTLSLDPPVEDLADSDEYPVDRTVGTGAHSRWRTQVAIGVAVRYSDRREQDSRLLAYTSAVLDQPIEVTGHPIVSLFVGSTADDGTVFLYLEDVDPQGRIAYVTEGQLRMCHRRLSDETPPYRQPVPFRTFTRAAARPVAPGEVAELTFDLLPTSYVFGAGHHIRVAIAGADASHFAVLPDGPSTLNVHRSQLYPSRIDLPVVAR